MSRYLQDFLKFNPVVYFSPHLFVVFPSTVKAITTPSLEIPPSFRSGSFGVSRRPFDVLEDNIPRVLCLRVFSSLLASSCPKKQPSWYGMMLNIPTFVFPVPRPLTLTSCESVFFRYLDDETLYALFLWGGRGFCVDDYSRSWLFRCFFRASHLELMRFDASLRTLRF